MTLSLYIMALSFSISSVLLSAYPDKPYYSIATMCAVVFYFIASSQESKLKKRIRELERKLEDKESRHDY